MVFSSYLFLFYFLPITLLVYQFSPKNWKNGILLLSSIFFYAWGAPKFVFVILATTLVDFAIANKMAVTSNKVQRKLLLSLAIIINVGLLAYFKYVNFFIENVNQLFTYFGLQTFPFAQVILPIGISFYTFETLTFIIDVYRGTQKPLKNFWNYQLYIMFFPKLIAGPIIKYHQIADQIINRIDNPEQKMVGFYRFCIGLAKKVLIANAIGTVVNDIDSLSIDSITSSQFWLASICYTFQLYFDFSGYSDMAVGLGLMFNFRIPENFNMPYIATSITDFWRRWHISLGAWMKEYLYLPLGGNRVNSKLRLFFNLWLVFLISGLWHGASWNFVLWGIYHGFFLIIERAFLLKWYSKLPKLFSWAITFFIVLNGWVLFKTESMNDVVLTYSKMYQIDSGFQFYIPIEFRIPLYFAIFFSFIGLFGKFEKKIISFFNADTFSLSNHLGLIVISMLLLLLSCGALFSDSYNPFIYFRF